MAKMIKYREPIDVVSYRLAFDYVGHARWGFAFDCDAAGNVNVAALNPDAQRSYIACLTGTVDGRAVGKPYVDEWHMSYVAEVRLRQDREARRHDDEQVPVRRLLQRQRAAAQPPAELGRGNRREIRRRRRADQVSNIISVTVQTVDHLRKTRQFKTLDGARAFAQRYVGETPELGSSYAVSADGVATVRSTAPLGLLFPKSVDTDTNDAVNAAGRRDMEAGHADGLAAMPKKGDPCLSCGGMQEIEADTGLPYDCYRCFNTGVEQ